MKIIIILFVLLIIILFLPFCISINIKKDDDKNTLKIRLKIFKIIKLSYEISLNNIINTDNKIILGLNKMLKDNGRKKSVNKKNISLKLENIIQSYDKFKKNKMYFKILINYIWKKIKFINVKAVMKLGFEDAATTAITTGFFWSILYSILSMLLNYKEIKDYFIDVIPEFNKSCFEVEFNCIIRLKLVYIIIAGYKSAKVKIKGGVTNV